eukprot:CAMPEP_0170119432 /NCGR_PEP_ID=MMETSP0020_2-20130122/14390_1 /TAXON_ID=98059 /ORGANISM="Dinobryon sp., Strain UTEXLB2267" /LENGTH=871 /DNA_ID=CAMNT_0010348797 /DNA_START=71 /DNA_END=2686 /DNA_ORIENTATION=-
MKTILLITLISLFELQIKSLDILPPDYDFKSHVNSNVTRKNSVSAGLVDIIYHNGGQVMPGTVNIYNIYYGDFSSTSSQQMISLVDYFSQNLGNTPWYKILTSYYQIVGGIKTMVSANVLYKSSHFTAVTAKLQTITQTTITNTISSLIASGDLPVDENGVYAVIFRGDLSYTAFGTSWLTGWCGYHTTFTHSSGKSLKFFVTGDPSTAAVGTSCEGYRSTTANGNIGADSIASIYAHELVETVSDFNGNAWYFADGNENADACAWKWGTLLPGLPNANIVVGNKNFLVQQNWQPGVGCVLGSQAPVIAPTPAPTVYVPPTVFVPITCAAYSATNTASATQNYATCTFTACAGVSLRIADCDASRCASGVNNDQYIRLYDGSGAAVASNDDSCNRCSIITYTTSGVCQKYTLFEGCYSSNSCSGVFTISDSSISSSPTTAAISSPSVVPTAPLLTRVPTAVPTARLTALPTVTSNAIPTRLSTLSPTPKTSTQYSTVPSKSVTLSPTTTVSPTSSGVIKVCASYTATATSSAQVNYVDCTFSVVGGIVIQISDCDANRCGVSTNDQYIRLLNSAGTLVAYNDDYCQRCSSLTYSVPSGASQTFTLRQGCFSVSTCSGTFKVISLSPLPMVISCPAYTATNTYSATANYVPCSFTACAGVNLVISDCDPSRCSSGVSNDQYIRLANAAGYDVALSDDSCSRCSKISYTTTGACQTYTLKQGCYSSASCYGTFNIAATGGSITRMANTNRNPAPNPVLSTDFSKVTCPFYSTTLTKSATRNTVECKFSACPGNTLYIRDCDGSRCPNYQGVANDQFIRLLNSTDDVVATNDNSCGTCSAITLTIQGSVCQTFTLVQGCKGNTACVGAFTITNV